MTSEIDSAPGGFGFISDDHFLTICRSAMDQNRISQGTVAIALGVSRSNISRMLAGKRSLTDEQKGLLCDAIGLDRFHVKVVWCLMGKPGIWDRADALTISRYIETIVNCFLQRLDASDNDIYRPLQPRQLGSLGHTTMDKIFHALAKQSEALTAEVA